MVRCFNLGVTERIKKRKVKDVPIFTDKGFFEELYFQFLSKHWKYKTLPQLYQVRDNAICAGLLLTGCRPSELALIQKHQIRNLDDRIIFTNIQTLKRGHIRPKIFCSKTSDIFSKFTELLERWFVKLEERDDVLFPSGSAFGLNFKRSLTRKRIERVVKKKTGLFPAWFRGVHETYYGNVVFRGNAWKLKEYMGLRFVDSTAPYVQTSYERDIEDRLFS